MKIIDAHLHYQPDNQHFDRIAANAGHENTPAHVASAFQSAQIVHGVVMGNRDLSPDSHAYPNFLSYCVGLHEQALAGGALEKSIEQVERHLCRGSCVGIKIYAGYCRRDLIDPAYIPFYELAQTYQKPVAVHMGVTASPNALLKYCHPMQLDEPAVLFPGVQFVMCHLGNPWLTDAAAVLEKNDNVAADLSGLLVGRVALDEYLSRLSGYTEQLKTWIAYVENYDKFLYGTDWPLVNMNEYIAFISHLIPEKHLEAVFFSNANRIYQLGL